MLSRNLFTSGGDDLGAVRVPKRNRIHRASVARAQQPVPIYLVRFYEHGDPTFYHAQRLRRPSKASPRPVETMLRTVCSGRSGTVLPPISTPSDDTSCVSIGFVSMATTRPHLGHLNVAASVPSPGSCRSPNAIC